jgi:hypothetical protein
MSGLSEKMSAIYGVCLDLPSWVVEVFDGFSKEWALRRRSGGQLARHRLFMAQQLGWKDQRILLNVPATSLYSASFNGDQMGRTVPDTILKDFLPHYGLSANSPVWHFRKIPKMAENRNWFGAEGLTGPRSNPEMFVGRRCRFSNVIRSFICSDIDLTVFQHS